MPKKSFFFNIPGQWHTFQVLSLELLAAGLVLKLVVLTDKAVTEGAFEHPSPMIPHPSVTLNARGVRQRACAGVTGETLTTMTHPSLTEVTDGTLERGGREGGERDY
jgi:hypothetical protein